VSWARLLVLLVAFTTTLALPAPCLRAQDDCSTLGQVTFVKDALEEFYYWYRELPDLDPADFDSPEAYLEAARFRPLDESFSFVASREAQQAYYSESQFVGLGFSTKQTGPEELRIAQVFSGSPASEAGLARGDRLTEIDGQPVPELLRAGGVSFGPREVGIAVELAWRTLAGEERRALLVKRPVTIPTVSQTGVLDVDGHRIGYLHFRNFVSPSIDALDVAFTSLADQAVSDLVLDLRYNGGGLLSVAQHLAGLIGGTPLAFSDFARMVHNDKNSFRDQTLLFPDPAAALALPRLVVLTTQSSASASELIINALRPFIPVTIVGDRTFGKPVGQYGFEFCDKVLNAVAFTIHNAAGQGDFFGGFEPDCAAADDLDHPLGEPAEASLAEALHYLQTGRCSPQAQARAQTRRAVRYRPMTRDPWQRLVNAH